MSIVRPGAGRKAKPAALHALAGNPGHLPREKLQLPEVSVIDPKPLAFMDEAEVGWFHYYRNLLQSIGLSSESYEATLSLAALRTLEIERCSEVIRQEGMSYPTETQGGGIMWRTRPEVTQRNEAMRHLHTLLAEMGLTPASIGRIQSGKPQQEKDPFQALLEDQ